MLLETDNREPPGTARGSASLQWAHKVALEGRVVSASLIVALVLASAFAVVGRSEQGDLSHRVLLSIACAVVCWPPCHALAAVIPYLLRSRPPGLIALAAACGTFFFTLFCAAVAYMAYGLFYPDRVGAVPILPIYVNVTLVTVVASAVMHLVVCQVASTRHALATEDAHADGIATGPVVSTAPAPAADHASWFFERVPSELGREIVCLRVWPLPQGRDHGWLVPRAVAAGRRREGPAGSGHAGPSLALGGASARPGDVATRAPDGVAGHGRARGSGEPRSCRRGPSGHAAIRTRAVDRQLARVAGGHAATRSVQAALPACRAPAREMGGDADNSGTPSPVCQSDSALPAWESVAAVPVNFPVAIVGFVGCLHR